MLLVLDWDGTLCDSTGRIAEAMQMAAHSAAAQVPSRESVREVIGLGLPEAVRRLFPGLDDAGLTRVREAYSNHYVDLDEDPSQLFPGVHETLEALRERGHRLTVATGKSRRGLDRVLRALQLEDYFDATRCADETRSKPHPMMLQQLLREFESPPAQALVVGDSEYDLLMARSVSVASVAVSYGVHDADRLRRHGPLAVVDSFSELLTLRAPDLR